MQKARFDPARSEAAYHVVENCLALRTRRLNRLVTRVYNDALRSHGLTLAQHSVLTGIAVAGPLRAAPLAAALGLEKSTLSRNLQRLSERGWVRKRPQLELTEAGFNVLEQARPAWRTAQNHTAQRLGADAGALLDALCNALSANPAQQ